MNRKDMLFNMLEKQTGDAGLVNILRNKDKQGLREYVMNTCKSQNKNFNYMYEQAKVYAKNNLGL